MKKPQIVLIRKLLAQGLNHLSLAIIFFSAGGFFLTNIILKNILSPNDFGEFSLLITYFSLVYIFGLYGFEQVFIRLSKIEKKNVISTQSFQINLVSKITIISSVIGTILFKKLYSEIEINTILLFISTYSMINLMWIFTIFRLNADFSTAQLFANFWKIFLFITAVLIFFRCIESSCLMNVLLFSIIFSFIAALFLFKKKIRFTFDQRFNKTEIVNYSFHFFLSILIFSLLTFGDRFIFNELFGIQEFGNYYFLCNFFLAPFSIFQNYLGFKHIVQFKQSFKEEIFDRLVGKATMLGVIIGVAMIFFSYVNTRLMIISFDFSKHSISIGLLICIGITKLYYAIISSLFEATAETQTLKIVNLYFLLFLIAVFIIGGLIVKSVESMILFVWIVWVFRCVILKITLSKQIKNKSIYSQ